MYSHDVTNVYIRHPVLSFLPFSWFGYKRTLNPQTIPNNKTSSFFLIPTFTSTASNFTFPITFQPKLPLDQPSYSNDHPNPDIPIPTVMSSIVSSVSDLISSIFEVFRSIFATIISALDSVLAVFTNLVRSVFDLMSGLVGFVLGEFPLLCMCTYALHSFQSSLSPPIGIHYIIHPHKKVIEEVSWGMKKVSQESKKNCMLMCLMDPTGNIVIIGVIIAAYVGYTAYKQKNQGGGISKKRS